MNTATANIDKFHRTRHGKVAFGVLELLLAYLIASRALDSGSLWQYLLAVLLLIGGLNNLLRSAFPKRKRSNAKDQAKKR